MSKDQIKLTEKVSVGEYTLEYSNFTILVKKHNDLVKCIDVKRDFTPIEYGQFVKKFEKIYRDRKISKP